MTVKISSLFVFSCAVLTLLCFADTVQADVSATLNVRSYGAKGDGVALDTSSINSAIDAATTAGGGTVEFPPGTYLSASIHLRSNVTLLLDAGATVEAAPVQSGAAYDAAEDNPAAGNYEDFGHIHFHNSLIWGENLTNVGIVGPGRILGTGLKHDEDHTVGTGNKSIALKSCRHVTLRDFTIQHGGWFGILATGDDDLTIDNLKIDTNRDGMDIDCCRNVHITDCTVNSPHDDGICLKSSYALGYARATENVTITGCTVSGFDEGTMLDGTYKHPPFDGHEGETFPCGRIKLGTESNGGFVNIAISNCIFEYCAGLALETVDGATLEDVSISNITMRNIDNSPIFIRLGARLRGPAGTVIGDAKRISISNVICYGADQRSGCIIAGLPDHEIEDVSLSNIGIWYLGGGTPADAPTVVPEHAAEYPDPHLWRTMPSYGMFIRHVKGITLNNVQLHTLTPDARPPYILTDVQGIVAYNADGVTTSAAAH